MPRVIAGSAGGRRIAAPPGKGTRPTADRVKEALFSSLGDLHGLWVLDLYAGSGGLGIEALSRGAAAAVLVEQDRRAAAVIGDNLAIATVTDRAQVVATSVAMFAANPVGGPFDLILADPPYTVDLTDLCRVLDGLDAAGALPSRIQLVVERDRRLLGPSEASADTAGLRRQGFVHHKDRTYSDTVLRYYHRRVPDQ